MAVGTASAAYAVPVQDMPLLMWLFVFAALVAGSIFAWNHPKAATSIQGWLLYCAGSFLVGVLYAMIDADVRGAADGHVVFDLWFGLAGSLICVAGLVRCFFQRRGDAA